jgi:TolB protein
VYSGVGRSGPGPAGDIGGPVRDGDGLGATGRNGIIERMNPRHARFACLLSLTLLACLLPAAPAQAGWPGKNGAIAFSRNGDDGRNPADIWVQIPGGTQRQLTSGPGSDTEPTYSRDGRLIAFVRYSGGGSDVWVMNRDGTNERPVTHTPDRVFATEPAFFRGGLSLAFALQGVVPGPTVFSIRTNGRGQRQLVGKARSPVVSPDGQWLAYRRHPGDNRIHLKDLRTQEERTLPTIRNEEQLSMEPDFSPDSRRLVFVGTRGCGSLREMRRSLFTIGLNDRRPRILLDACHRKFVPFGPAWSPSGNRIAFTGREGRRKASGVRLRMLDLRGRLVPGAPRHRPGTFETSPAWQP